jgi:hypothetical protein
MSHDKVSKVVEDICRLGCTTVNEIIETLEHGDDVSQTKQLSRDERGELLHELKSIMDVYQRRD